jgi:hypothetical protein
MRRIFQAHGKLFVDPTNCRHACRLSAEGEDMPDFIEVNAKMVAECFCMIRKMWSAELDTPPHKGIESESGTLMTTSNQIWKYTGFLCAGRQRSAYGYYAMSTESQERRCKVS